MVSEAIRRGPSQGEFRIRRDGADQTIAVTPRMDGDVPRIGMFMNEATRSVRRR
jgi:hypothetical protein